MPIGTMGWLAYCEDTEGNPFGLWETVPQTN
jgi:predicted enzyme related to lactoylglutathione lyase